MKPTLMLGAAVLLASATVPAQRAPTPPAPPALSDANVVAIFDAANTADIETSELAAQKGASADTRSTGSQFASDHRNLRQQGRDLAKRLSITGAMPDGDKSASDHARAMADLQGKTGAAFDAAYAAHEVTYHQAVIDNLTQTLIPAVQNPELKTFMQNAAPAFQAHLQAAQELQHKLGS
ncbi:MAG TPA: DUF4142 domain-containing protein [Gemmatimonadales bacterium]